MEENMQQNSSTEAAVQVDTPMPASTPPMSPMESASTATVVHATFLQRFLAVLIDAVLVGLVVGVSGIILTPILGGDDGVFYNPLGVVLGPGYAIFMLVKYGATLGKMALGIKVVKQDGSGNINVVEGFLREVVGKFLSSFFLIGYLWMLWDANKQTWHDKIAGTLVVKA